MRPVDLILRKRNGGKLTSEEIHTFLEGYTKGDIPDYQMAAMAMAICFQGLDPDELTAWTASMMNSGQILRWDKPGPYIDKHSTGGVGDKVSLLLAPLCAAAGLKVPMISGRGLGHTGGTLDKLESLEGFDTRLSLDKLREVVAHCGAAITGQTGEIAPADQKLYGLRDVTGTVKNHALIVSSIMSKKLAEGLDGLVLDVKVGKGAFMKDLESAQILARKLVDTGKAMGVPTHALLTDMDQPLGLTIGNALEMAEALETLQGGGPKDLIEITCALTAEMLILGKLFETREEAYERALSLLKGGQALDTMRRMVKAQGGNPEAVTTPGFLGRAYHDEIILSPKDGYITGFDCEELGKISMSLGAGRMKAGDEIDHSVGIILHRKKGDKVEMCDTLATLCFNQESNLDELRNRLVDAIQISKEPPEPRALILGRVE